MTWQEKNVFQQTTTPEGRPIAVAVRIERHCGCLWVEGLALDQPADNPYGYEPAFGGFACDEHEAVMVEALARLIEMPGSQTAVRELAQEVFEQTLNEAPPV